MLSGEGGGKLAVPLERKSTEPRNEIFPAPPTVARFGPLWPMLVVCGGRGPKFCCVGFADPLTEDEGEGVGARDETEPF